MSAPRWVGTLTVAGIAVLFASNHVAARAAFDHGASVVAAVAVRSAGTALAVALLLRAARTTAMLPPAVRGRAVVVGLALAVQSACLYAAVARLPVALALLTFNTFPLVLAALSWASGGERPTRATLAAIPVILAGLVLALDLPGVLGSGGASLADPARFAAGIAFALAAAVAFAIALLLTARWLGPVDGRVRTLWATATVAVVTVVAGTAAQAFAWPTAAGGWAGLVLLTLFYGAAITSLFVVLPRLGAVNNSPAMNAEPIASLVIAWAVLGQRVAPLQVAGALLVVGAIVWLGTRR